MRIEVFLPVGGNCWCARYVNDPDILELFETDTLPLPFTPEAKLEDVLRAVRKSDPRAEVIAVEPPSSTE
jgi:hypothetical protein